MQAIALGTQRLRCTVLQKCWWRSISMQSVIAKAHACYSLSSCRYFGLWLSLCCVLCFPLLLPTATLALPAASLGDIPCVIPAGSASRSSPKSSTPLSTPESCSSWLNDLATLEASLPPASSDIATSAPACGCRSVLCPGSLGGGVSHGLLPAKLSPCCRGGSSP